MGYLTNGLSFHTLRAANLRRLPEFKNAKGEPAHEKSDGSDWKLSAWSNAVLGELGEAANIIKKVERGDLTLDQARDLLADELADAATYLDLLAYRAQINLGQAVAAKFNRKSHEVGSRVYIGTDDWHLYEDDPVRTEARRIQALKEKAEREQIVLVTATQQTDRDDMLRVISTAHRNGYPHGAGPCVCDYCEEARAKGIENPR